ncbi:hypothetical protein PF004_g30995 [Phytophthora fragariae]|uniref:Secreted protein n=1 Tax=Phytophthora fragariae TaxID=53985 RepID=A0A6G0MBI7_9STRA|nr:hypothetical protein PF004_g30995 [Phytophthora fragariae]
MQQRLIFALRFAQLTSSSSAEDPMCSTQVGFGRRIEGATNNAENSCVAAPTVAWISLSSTTETFGWMILSAIRICTFPRTSLRLLRSNAPLA